MCGKETSIARMWSAAKFQVRARKIPASFQDWCGLLLYSLWYPARVSRGQSSGGALCVASMLRAWAQVASHRGRRGQGGQHRRGMTEQGVGRACAGSPGVLAGMLLMGSPHTRLCAPSCQG